jgi:hypothetical protein
MPGLCYFGTNVQAWGFVDSRYCVRIKLSSRAECKHCYLREVLRWHSNPYVPEYRSSWRDCCRH